MHLHSGLFCLSTLLLKGLIALLSKEGGSGTERVVGKFKQDNWPIDIKRRRILKKAHHQWMFTAFKILHYRSG